MPLVTNPASSFSIIAVQCLISPSPYPCHYHTGLPHPLHPLAPIPHPKHHSQCIPYLAHCQFTELLLHTHSCAGLCGEPTGQRKTALPSLRALLHSGVRRSILSHSSLHWSLHPSLYPSLPPSIHPPSLFISISLCLPSPSPFTLFILLLIHSCFCLSFLPSLHLSTHSPLHPPLYPSIIYFFSPVCARP